ncbi:hypothetical protein K0M31_002253 [Melipona bicolor]|uniref:Uncharacterized protein n=1 Tax=Melipona bicolor TaxID=60889 RepID=A0AA40GHD6_9HYME|nr:hypothetical protein K0M31_002253 [Melipona bicolor]
MITPEARNHNDAGGLLSANYDKQQHQDNCITSDNEILGSSHSIEILQTQYLLKTSHENNVTAETVHIYNSLPGFVSKRLTKHCLVSYSTASLGAGTSPNRTNRRSIL